jgi:hypothetical protein
MAAFLSIALGTILAFAARTNMMPERPDAVATVSESGLALSGK